MPSQTNLGIFTTDCDLVIQSWNEWLAQVTGIAARDAVGRHLNDVVPDLTARGLGQYFAQSLEKGVMEVLASPVHHYVIPCPPLHSSRRFDLMQQNVTIAPLKADEHIAGLIVTVEDVTDKVEGQQDESLLEVFGHENWAFRRNAVDRMTRCATPETLSALLRMFREQHRNLSVMNSALRVLTSSGVDTLTPFAELLNDPDHELRMYAALALGELNNRGAIPALVRALADSDNNVRYHVIEALGKIKAVEAAGPLLEIAQAGDFSLAFPAIDALAQLGDPEIAIRLVPLLQNEMVCTEVVDALGKLGDERVVAPLVALLGRPGPHVPFVAQAIADIHDRYDEQLGEGAHVADIVRKHVPANAATSVIEALDESDSHRLRGLVQLLGWIDDDDIAGALTRLLGSEEVRKEVVEALVRHGKGVTQALVRQLGSDDVAVRRAAVLALGRIGDPECVPHLVSILTEDSEIAVPTAWAVARIGDSRAYEALMDLLGHPSPAARQAVIAAINSLGDSRTKPDVMRLMNDPNPYLRESAVRISGYFGYPDCAHLIVERVDDPDENVRSAAIESLPYLDHPNVAQILFRTLGDDSPRIRAAAAQALGYVEGQASIRQLIGALADKDAWVRYYAARSLGRLRSPEALDCLMQRANSDPVTHVRIAAAEALAAVGGGRAATALTSLLDSPERDLSRTAAMALGSIGHPDALPPLMAMARSENRHRRIDAIRGLGVRSDRQVIELLEQIAANDPDPDASSAAINELASIGSADAVASVVRLTAQPSLRERCIVALAAADNNCLDNIGAGLQHPQFEVRRAIIEALSRKRHPRASHLLGQALDDEAAPVRLSAVLALARLGSHHSERKLALMGTNDADPTVRSAARKALER